MKRNEEIDLFVPQRQSIAAILIILLKFGKQMIRQFWPILLIFLFNRKGSKDLIFGIIISVLSLVSLLGSIISYFKYYFYIKDGELNVRKGVLRKTSLNVPFERIQSIDFEQNVIHQLFDVVAVKIDTAGSKGSELEIHAISKNVAYALRDYILKEKEAIQGASSTEEESVWQEETKQLVFSLDPIDLLKIGISQNHFRTAAIVLGIFLSIADDLGEVLGFDVFDKIEEGIGQLVQAGLLFIFIFIPVFIFISFLITLVRTVFQYFNLKFWKTQNGFKLISGLLTRKEKSMQKDKVQIIGWSNNPIKKLFGIYRLRMYQAASVDVVGNKSMIIPGVYKEQIDETISTVIPMSVGASFERHGIHPLSRLRFVWFFGFLPLLAVTGIAYLNGQSSLYLTWLYLPVCIWMAHQYYLKRGLQLHPDYLIAEGGIFGRSHKMIELYKVQGVQLSQGWYETRKDLSAIHIFTAAGEIKVPYIPIAKARKLRDYILYRVERSKENWI